jgi:broad specificity phosphatase PhoE
MRTIQVGEWIVHHNSDFSGEILFEKVTRDRDWDTFSVPYDVLEAVVLERVKARLHEFVDNQNNIQALFGV